MSPEKERHVTYRRDEGITNGGNNRPIECQNAHTQPSVCSKQGIDNDILGSNPAHPVEHAQSCEKVFRDPAPNEAPSHGDPKEALAGHVALIAVTVVLVDGIEEDTS